jgi:hypothetical protein
MWLTFYSEVKRQCHSWLRRISTDCIQYDWMNIVWDASSLFGEYNLFLRYCTVLHFQTRNYQYDCLVNSRANFVNHKKKWLAIRMFWVWNITTIRLLYKYYGRYSIPVCEFIENRTSIVNHWIAFNDERTLSDLPNKKKVVSTTPRRQSA